VSEEAAANVHWDFPSQAWPGIQIKGQSFVRKLSEAQKIVQTMNAEYGEGTHWVEPLNQSYEELHDYAGATLPSVDRTKESK